MSLLLTRSYNTVLIIIIVPVTLFPLCLILVVRLGIRRPPVYTKFFVDYLVTISFANRVDVWVRLCTHLETVNVMTSVSVT